MVVSKLAPPPVDSSSHSQKRKQRRGRRKVSELTHTKEKASHFPAEEGNKSKARAS